MNMIGVSDLTVYANNVSQLRDFYVKLGFEVVFGDDKLVVLRAGQQELAIHTSEHTPRGALGFSVVVNDVDAAARTLRDQGLKFERHEKPFHAGKTGISLEDPNGNRVNLLAR